MLETVEDGGRLLAIIVRKEFSELGISFFTPESFSQQLAFMKHPAAHEIAAHVHIPVERNLLFTQEILFIRKGLLRVDFYDDGRRYLESRLVGAGDVLLLASGGHGMKILEELEMFEVKQGPYHPGKDKEVFESVVETDVILKGET